MEFFISTSALQRAIKLLSVTAKMNVTSFEGQILIETGDEKVTFTSRNSNSGLSCQVPAKIVEAGSSNVLYSKIKSFIMTFAPWDGELGAKQFHFKVEHPKMKIDVEIFHGEGRSSKSNLSLEQIKASSFLSPVKAGEPNLILNSSIIRSAIDKALYAVDPNSTEKFTKGIRMFIKDGMIIFTATNGRVVSDYRVPSAEIGAAEGEYFLSHEFILGLRRILIDDTQLFFDIDKKKIKISFDDVLFWSNGLSYDRWPSAIEGVWSNYDKTIALNREILLSGMSSFVDILDPDDFDRVTLEKSKEKLFLRTDNSLFEYPEVDDQVEFVVDISGKDLINSLNALSEDMIKLKCLDSKNGVILESDGFDDQKAFITNLTLKKR